MSRSHTRRRRSGGAKPLLTSASIRNLIRALKADGYKPIYGRIHFAWLNDLTDPLHSHYHALDSKAVASPEGDLGQRTDRE